MILLLYDPMNEIKINILYIKRLYYIKKKTATLVLNNIYNIFHYIKNTSTHDTNFNSFLITLHTFETFYWFQIQLSNFIL